MPNKVLPQQQGPAQAPMPQSVRTVSPADFFQRQSGKEANREFLDKLVDLADAETTGVTKRLVTSSLEALRTLSARPGQEMMDKAGQIYEEAAEINQDAADKYIWPYVERVLEQQERNTNDNEGIIDAEKRPTIDEILEKPNSIAILEGEQ